MIIGDYTTQYIGDYKHPIGEIPINQPGLNGLTEGFLDTAHLNMENLKNYNFQPTKSPFKAWFSLIGKCPFKWPESAISRVYQSFRTWISDEVNWMTTAPVPKKP